MKGEEGAATVLILAVAALLITLTMATVALGAAGAARTEAQNAADAAALAAAVATYPPASTLGPVESAKRVATANGAILVSCRCQVDRALRPRVVLVTTYVPVELPLLGEVRARGDARAEFDPIRWLGR